MYEFDNSRRMQKLQKFMSKETKKIKKRPSKKNGRSVGTASTNSAPSTTDASSPCEIVLEFKCIRFVQTSWKKILGERSSEQLGDSIILRMIEIDPTCRSTMKITSFRSEHSLHVFETVVEVLSALIDSLGPEVDPDQVWETCAPLRKLIVPGKILVKAVVKCIEDELKTMTALQQGYWNRTVSSLLLFQYAQKNTGT